VSPVKYELGFYIPEDDILHSHRRENLKPYIAVRVPDCNQTNSMTFSPQANYTERPHLSAKLMPTISGRGVSRGQCNAPPHGRQSWDYRPEAPLFHSSGSSVIFMRLSGTCSRPAVSQKIW
jgi:hypothetical protein